MNDDKLIRHFDFTNDLVVELADPAVREAYLKWRAAADAQSALPLFAPDDTGTEPLYDAFLAIARARQAVYPLT